MAGYNDIRAETSVDADLDAAINAWAARLAGTGEGEEVPYGFRARAIREMIAAGELARVSQEDTKDLSAYMTRIRPSR